MIKMYNEVKEFKNNNLLKGYNGAVGYDIRSGEEYLLPPGVSKMFYTGLHVCLPKIFGATITSKKWLAYNFNIEASNAGSLSPGAHGRIRIRLINQDLNNSYLVRNGERIAKMMFFIRPEEFFSSAYNSNSFRISEVDIDAWRELLHKKVPIL